MPSSKQTPGGKGAKSVPDARAISRRDFLRIAGLSGAAITVSAGLGGLAVSCGETGTTNTTTAATTSGAQATTTISAATTTSSAAATTSAGVEVGREIKVGFVAPLTGAIALFGVPDQYCAARWEEAVKEGLVCGDGKNHPVKVLIRDSQSDSNRAAQVGGDLIANDKVDVIMAASTNDTVTPVAGQAEAMGCPMFSNDAPWQAYYFSRNPPPEGFKWTWHAFWGLEDIIGTFTSMWESLQTNKKVAGMWPNDADGNAWADPKVGFPGVLPGMGYTVVYGGGYQNGTEDYTSIITAIKKEGCEILTGVPLPPDFPVMWNQMLQQGFKPPVASVGKALLFPLGLEAIGPTGYGLSTEVWWTPRHPFKSSLTGETCKQLADDFESRTGLQWTQPLLHYGVFEVVVDALKRCPDVDDKEAIVKAISTTKMETIAGPIDFTSPVDPNSLHPVPNVYRTPLVGGQWVKGTGKWPFELVIVDNKMGPAIATEAKLQPIQYG